MVGDLHPGRDAADKVLRLCAPIVDGERPHRGIGRCASAAEWSDGNFRASARPLFMRLNLRSPRPWMLVLDDGPTTSLIGQPRQPNVALACCSAHTEVGPSTQLWTPNQCLSNRSTANATSVVRGPGVTRTPRCTDLGPPSAGDAAKRGSRLQGRRLQQQIAWISLQLGVAGAPHRHRICAPPDRRLTNLTGRRETRGHGRGRNGSMRRPRVGGRMKVARARPSPLVCS